MFDKIVVHIDPPGSASVDSHINKIMRKMEVEVEVFPACI